MVPALTQDEATLDGVPLAGRPLARVVELLDRVRALGKTSARARVRSTNEVPTAAGLASSASGFAALALAASRAYGLTLSKSELSALARASSASAARSIYGGWTALDAGARSAEQVASEDHLAVSMIVTLTAAGPKAVSSTEGMQLTARTSPYFPAWVAEAPRLFDEVRCAVLARDLEALGAAMEQSAMMMHASMLAARPALVYWNSTTFEVIERVKMLRKAGVLAFYTMDAGPHVKVLTTPELAPRVQRELDSVQKVEKTIVCAPGPDARVAGDESGGARP
jgi:diphosphomevalonate decarboxylase